MWSQPQLSRQSHLEGGVGFGDVIEFGMLPENSAELSFGSEPCEKRRFQDDWNCSLDDCNQPTVPTRIYFHLPHQVP